MARAKKGGQSRENKSSETAGRHLDEPQQTFSRSTAETALPLPCSVPLEIENGHIFSSRNAGRDDNTRAGFTLTDEARQTSLHDRSFWSSHTALRKNPVQFISTGQSNPLECKYTTEMSTDATNVRTTSQLEQHDQQGSFPQKKDQLETSHLLSKASCQGGIHNCTEDHTQLFGHETFKPVSSQFSGGGGSFRCDKIRWGTAHNINQPTSLLEHQFSPDTSSSDEVILFQGRKSRKEGKVITSYPSKRSVSPTSSAGSRYSGDDSYDLHMSPNLPTTRKQPKRKTYGTRKSTDDDILLDYINNMRDNGELDCVFDDEMSNQHDLGAKDDDFSFGSLSSVDEKPKASQASDYIKEENAKKYRKKNGSTSDTIKPSRLYDDDNGDSVGDLSDENALVTLIAAQHLSSVSATGVRKSPSSVSDNRPWTDNLGGEQFAFDFMDWNRPSVRRGRKSKRVQNQHMSFNNCDSDLERQLQMAWKSDRFRKKDRKQQREELRALEMLRKKTKPDDLRVKYPSGMTIEEVAEELRIFLQRNDEVVSFPPMDFHARKVIHELADKFNIKSKSTGKADQRRPTLYRTIRTLPYAEAAFDQAINRIQRRFLPRLDTKGKRNTKPNTTRCVTATAASYREGEIVGAAAPELGLENRGRAMLEKMGWCRGTALGATNNKGILLPVTHAMKKSKAGLG